MVLEASTTAARCATAGGAAHIPEELGPVKDDRGRLLPGRARRRRRRNAERPGLGRTLAEERECGLVPWGNGGAVEAGASARHLAKVAVVPRRFAPLVERRRAGGARARRGPRSDLREQRVPLPGPELPEALLELTLTRTPPGGSGAQEEALQKKDQGP